LQERFIYALLRSRVREIFNLRLIWHLISQLVRKDWSWRGEVKYAKPRVHVGTQSAGALVLFLGRTISDRHLGTPSSASRIVL